MSGMNKHQFGEFKTVTDLLVQTGCIAPEECKTFMRDGEILPMHSDGSCRRFFRVRRKGNNLCLVVAPNVAEGNDLEEARSAWLIGKHLKRSGVPVPEIYGWDEKSGRILFEDLGDVRLQDLLKEKGTNDLRSWYCLIIDQLVSMQIEGGKGFDSGWCWDTPRYDKDIMIARESQYFLKSYWLDMMGKKMPDGIDDEFATLASRIDGKVPDVFLHRDFQSRNIMIKDGEVRFIDFQAGRLGPPGYDLASLLIDPYMALDPEFQEELFEYYLTSEAIGRMFSVVDLRGQYPLLALQRNLQIIGAFAFLSQIRKKAFFKDYLIPAISMLHIRLQAPVFEDFNILRKMVESAIVSVRA